MSHAKSNSPPTCARCKKPVAEVGPLGYCRPCVKALEKPEFGDSAMVLWALEEWQVPADRIWDVFCHCESNAISEWERTAANAGFRVGYNSSAEEAFDPRQVTDLAKLRQRLEDRIGYVGILNADAAVDCRPDVEEVYEIARCLLDEVPAPPTAGPLPPGRAGVYLQLLLRLASVHHGKQPGNDQPTEGADTENKVETVYHFKCRNNCWDVRFDQESCLWPDNPGLERIARLLGSVGVPLSSCNLLGIGESIALPQQSRQLTQDKPTRATFQKARAEVTAQLEDARQRGNVEQIRDCQDALSQLDKLWSADTDRSGKSRKIDRTPQENAYDSVKRSIRRAVDAIRESMPQLADHLDRSVTHDSQTHTHKYTPPQSITWEFK